MDKPIETRSDDAATSVQLPGIKILAGLHVIIAAVRLFQENRVLGYAIYFHFADEKVTVYGPPFAMLMMANLVVLIIFFSGIGLWRRARWGWWLTGFVYSYVVIQSVYMMVGYYIRRDQLQEMGLTADYGRYVFRGILFVALMGYLYSRGVLEVFGIKNINKIKAAILQIVASILALAATTLAAIAIISRQGMSVPYIQ